MKIGIAVAPQDAPPSAFVILRGQLEQLAWQCAGMGYDGIELALRSADQVNLPALKKELRAAGMEVPCVSTGQVFAVDRLYFTHPDQAVRAAAVRRVREMILLAAELGAMVNTGRVRGPLGDGEPPELARSRYLESLERCAETALAVGVTLLIEPVNRYELNFVNTCAQAVDLIRCSGLDCLRVMPDLFHMNIEEADFGAAFQSAGPWIGYVHVADSNRLAPGWGHLPLAAILDRLRQTGYDGYLTVEALPEPTPEAAARQAATFLGAYLGRDTIVRK